MVDVQIGIGRQAFGHEINEALERSPLFLPVGGPIAHVAIEPVDHRVEIPEQKLQPAVADERVTFEVEENVAWRGFRKARKPKSCNRGNVSYRTAPLVLPSTWILACSRIFS